MRARFEGGGVPPLVEPPPDDDNLEEEEEEDEKEDGMGRVNLLREIPLMGGGRIEDREDEEDEGEGEDVPSPSTTSPSLAGLSSLSPTTSILFPPLPPAPISLASNNSASFPIGPPEPPPHRRRVVHHASFPSRTSFFPSRARCCAVMSAAMTSRDKSITDSRSRARGGKEVVWRGDTAARGPSMMPLLAESRSRGMR